MASGKSIELNQIPPRTGTVEQSDSKMSRAKRRKHAKELERKRKDSVRQGLRNAQRRFEEAEAAGLTVAESNDDIEILTEAEFLEQHPGEAVQTVNIHVE